MNERFVVLEIEVPVIHTGDLEELREFKHPDQSESEWLGNCLGLEESACRVRVEISGEKDSDVGEFWGNIRAVRLAAPSHPEITHDWLDQRAANKLLRDENSCEWCSA